MKKGEISTSFLIGLVLVILGGAVLLLAYSFLGQKEVIDAATCKTSVTARGTLPNLFKGASNLNCKTEKICIAPPSGLFSKKGKCESSFLGKSSEVQVEKISSQDFFLGEGKMDAKSEIERVIAQKVVECWEMMGSGKISIEDSKISESFGFGSSTSFCVVCSRIDVDESLLEYYNVSRENLSKTIKPFEYMRTRRYPGTAGSYLDYLAIEGADGMVSVFGGGVSVDYGNLFNNEELGFNPDSLLGEAGDKKDEFKQVAIVFSQASAFESPGVWRNYAISAGVVSYGLYKVLPSSVVLGAVKGIFSPAGGVVASALAIAAGAIQLNVWNNQALTMSYCGDLTHSDGSRRGCSAVRIVQYDSMNLNEYCGVIDGFP